MILLDRGQYEDAARELQRARQNGADSVEPVASFHEALRLLLLSGDAVCPDEAVVLSAGKRS